MSRWSQAQEPGSGGASPTASLRKARRGGARRQPASAESTAAELRALGVDARSYVADVAQREDGRHDDAPVAADFGRLDVLVNNAGISRIGPHTHETTDEDWLDSIAVMQTGVFYCMRAARAS